MTRPIERYIELLSGSKVESLRKEAQAEENEDRRRQLQNAAVDEEGKALVALMATHTLALAFIKGLELVWRRLHREGED